MKWTVEREDLHHPGVESEERYVASVGRLQREYADGRRGALVEYDGQSALRLPTGGGEPTALPVADQMMLSARYLLWEMTRPSFADEIPERVRHIGGDALVRPPRHRAGGGNYPDRGPILEVIEWPVGDQGTARFAFDADSGRIARVVVSDQVTNFEATLYFDGRCQVGTMRWPCAVELYVGDDAYRDSFSDWSFR